MVRVGRYGGFNLVTNKVRQLTETECRKLGLKPYYELNIPDGLVKTMKEALTK